MMSTAARKSKAVAHWRSVHTDNPHLLGLALAWLEAEYAEREINRVCSPTSPRSREAAARANEANRAYLRAKHGLSSVFALLG